MSLLLKNVLLFLYYSIFCTSINTFASVQSVNTDYCQCVSCTMNMLHAECVTVVSPGKVFLFVCFVLPCFVFVAWIPIQWIGTDGHDNIKTNRQAVLVIFVLLQYTYSNGTVVKRCKHMYMYWLKKEERKMIFPTMDTLDPLDRPSVTTCDCVTSSRVCSVHGLLRAPFESSSESLRHESAP